MGFFSDRRNRLVEGYLTRMVKTGATDVGVPDLYFDAACRYAQDNGGKLYPDMRDSIIFDKVIDGQNYSVFFLVGRGGKGTNITLTKKCDASTADDLVAPDGDFPTWAEDEDKRQAFIEGVFCEAERKGMPLAYAEGMFLVKESAKVFLFIAAEYEKAGNNFAQQQEGVATSMLLGWNNIDDSTRKKFLDYK